MKTALFGAGVVLCVLVMACSPGSPPSTGIDQAVPENPLPPCPGSPNCVRETHLFDAPPEALFARAKAALERLDPTSVSAHPETRRIEAVFTVFFFKDDVALVVTPHSTGAALHIRSASRVGKHDLGVNQRRVNRFLKALR